MTQDPPGRDALMGMITAYQTSQVIYAAAHLGIPDILARGQLPVGALARESGTDPATLKRLLRMLAAIGIVAETGDGAIELTPTGAHLRSDAPGSVRDSALFLAGPWFWKSWGDLLHSLKTGEPAFERIFGMTNFQYWEADAEAGAVHDRFFTTAATMSNAALVAAYDFSAFSILADVGGSEGPLLAAVLAANPELKGILFDLPHVVSGANNVLGAARVGDRCTVLGGDFFESVPSGADAYLLKYILHDWDDDRASRILRRVREACAPGNKLLVIEQVLPDRFATGPSAVQGPRLDLQMLVLTPGGRERTVSEYRTLLEAAGFSLERAIPTKSPFTILEAVAR